MLKRKEAASHPDDFVNGTFRPFIGDATADAQKVDTLLLCSGRVTWDLMVERAKLENAERFAIGRVEQLYPRPLDDIKHEIARYPNLKAVRWVQDEPLNMGPWPQLRAQRVATRRRQGRGDHPRRVLHACGGHREAAHRGAEGPHGAGVCVNRRSARNGHDPTAHGSSEAHERACELVTAGSRHTAGKAGT